MSLSLRQRQRLERALASVEKKKIQKKKGRGGRMWVAAVVLAALIFLLSFFV